MICIYQCGASANGGCEFAQTRELTACLAACEVVPANTTVSKVPSLLLASIHPGELVTVVSSSALLVVATVSSATPRAPPTMAFSPSASPPLASRPAPRTTLPFVFSTLAKQIYQIASFDVDLIFDADLMWGC